jgi:hypothetical protein
MCGGTWTSRRRDEIHGAVSSVSSTGKPVS